MAETGVYWLVDDIAAHLLSDGFQKAVRLNPAIEYLDFWTLAVNDDCSAWLIARADRNEPPFIRQKVLFTDFPLPSIDIWVGFDGQYYAIYLPSEH